MVYNFCVWSDQYGCFVLCCYDVDGVGVFWSSKCICLVFLERSEEICFDFMCVFQVKYVICIGGMYFVKCCNG